MIRFNSIVYVIILTYIIVIRLLCLYLKKLKSSITFKLVKLFFIISFAIILLLPFSVNSKLKVNFEDELKSSQVTYPEIRSFSSDVCLSIDDSVYPHHVGVSMAISDDDIIFVGWKNSESHNGGGARVSFTKSLDGGETWTYPYDMPMFEEHSTRQTHPWLYWYNDTIYYAYVEHEEILPEGGYLTQITVAKSDNDGETWTLVKATNGNYFANKETFTVSENNTIYVVYDDVDISSTGNTTVRLSRSIDGGISYQEIKNLGGDIDFFGPYVTLNSTGDIFIAWTWVPDSGGNLYFTKSSDGGQNFSQPKFINQDGNYCMFEEINFEPSKITLPVLEFDQNGRLYVLWADKFDQQGDTWDVYLRYSDNFGSTWSNRIRVNPSIIGNQWNPDMAIDRSGRLHIVYYSEIEGRYKPYYRTLNFTGPYRNVTIFSEEIAIAQSFTSSTFTRPGEYFSIQLDSNNIPHIVWSEGRIYEMDIYYSHGLTYVIHDSVPNELITIIVIILIFGVISIVIIFYIRQKHRLVDSNHKTLDKELDDKTKSYMKTFIYICSNCHKFSHTLREYCESCGAKSSLRLASKEDYRKYLLDLK